MRDKALAAALSSGKTQLPNAAKGPFAEPSPISGILTHSGAFRYPQSILCSWNTRG